jgi:hypothetical protein
MTWLWPDGESVQVTVSPDGIPLAFAWRNRMHRLTEIALHWRVDEGWWRGEDHAWREYWKVCSDTGLLVVIYSDLLTDKWYLQRLYD